MEFKICLPEPVLTYRALKSANISNKNKRLVKATVEGLTLDAMSIQLRKIMANMDVSNNSQARSDLVKRKTNVTIPDNNYIKPQEEETFVTNKFGSCQVSKPKENRKSQIGYRYSIKSPNYKSQPTWT